MNIESKFASSLVVGALLFSGGCGAKDTKVKASDPCKMADNQSYTYTPVNKRVFFTIPDGDNSLWLWSREEKGYMPMQELCDLSKIDDIRLSVGRESFDQDTSVAYVDLKTPSWDINASLWRHKGDDLEGSEIVNFSLVVLRPDGTKRVMGSTHRVNP